MVARMGARLDALYKGRSSDISQPIEAVPFLQAAWDAQRIVPPSKERRKGVGWWDGGDEGGMWLTIPSVTYRMHTPKYG